MRPIPLGIAILLLITPQRTLFTAEAGVPSGWSALQYDNFGNDLLNKDKYAESRKYFDAAIRLEPDRWGAYYNRATAFYMEKNWPAALQDLNTTIRLKPAFFKASWDRALVYEIMGNYTAALRDLDALVKVTFQVGNAAKLAHTLNQRAWLRATCLDSSFRNGQSALADAKRACDMNKWQRAQYIDTLAAAYAEVGDFDSAIRYEQQAIEKRKKAVGEKDKGIVNKNSTAGMIQHLESYKRHQPLRDTPGK